MEGAKRWGYASETTVRGKREPACPKPHAPVCCPSSVPSLRQPRNPCLQQGSQPVRAGVNLAVAPQGPCPPWPSHDRVGSRMTKRLPPWLDAPGSGGWRAPQPRQTCRSSPPCGTIPWDLSSGCRSESGRRRRLEQQRDQGGAPPPGCPRTGRAPCSRGGQTTRACQGATNSLRGQRRSGRSRTSCASCWGGRGAGPSPLTSGATKRGRPRWPGVQLSRFGALSARGVGPLTTGVSGSTSRPRSLARVTSTPTPTGARLHRRPIPP